MPGPSELLTIFVLVKNKRLPSTGMVQLGVSFVVLISQTMVTFMQLHIFQVLASSGPWVFTTIRIGVTKHLQNIGMARNGKSSLAQTLIQLALLLSLLF